jgi:hypothetical protein
MERTFSPFRRRLFKRVTRGFTKATALAAKFVLRTEDWRMKHGLSCFSTEAEAARRPLNRLVRQQKALPEEAQQEQINALLDAYDAAYKANVAT